MNDRWAWVDVVNRLHLGRRLTVYLDRRDGWVGVYLAEAAVYVCPLPFVVLRWSRRGRSA
jgi:hypothetical protein